MKSPSQFDFIRHIHTRNGFWGPASILFANRLRGSGFLAIGSSQAEKGKDGCVRPAGRVSSQASDFHIMKIGQSKLSTLTVLTCLLWLEFAYVVYKLTTAFSALEKSFSWRVNFLCAINPRLEWVLAFVVVILLVVKDFAIKSEKWQRVINGVFLVIVLVIFVEVMVEIFVTGPLVVIETHRMFE
ncbi:MAG: hypothetical protein V1809_02070 [Planctomycetota bacterium]